jgi:hypothetical protein
MKIAPPNAAAARGPTRSGPGVAIYRGEVDRCTVRIV